MAAPYFRLSVPSVVYEQFDDELVAIHLDRGSYHSVSGAGTEAFLLLVKGATAEELGQALAAKYAADAAEITTALAPFLEQLLEEQLIEPVETPAAREPLRIGGDERGLPFVAPVLQPFHDLEGLLLLDPIHEVGEEGWPAPPSHPLPE